MDLGIHVKEERVLGMLWNPVNDMLYFNARLKGISNDGKIDNITFTKRIAFSIVNGIFDPMGLISPVIVKGKILLRELTSI